MKVLFVFLLVAYTCCLYGEKRVESTQKEAKKKEEEDPLFFGTLLTIFPQNVDPGRLSIEPYFFVTDRPGTYGPDSSFIEGRSGQASAYLSLEGGLTKKLDISLTIPAAYTMGRKHTSTSFGDIGIYLGYQILKQEKKTWQPDVRLLLGETFPTGDFDELSPSFLGLDAYGSGAFQTYFILVLGKIFYVIPKHPWSINVNFSAAISSSTEVINKSLYGGGEGTHGIVFPGRAYVINVGFEQSLSYHAGLGIDIHWEHQDTSSFDAIALDAPFAGLPSSDRVSLAPCYEYNFNKDNAVEAGVWFSIWGRNAFCFQSAIVTIYHNF